MGINNLAPQAPHEGNIGRLGVLEMNGKWLFFNYFQKTQWEVEITRKPDNVLIMPEPGLANRDGPVRRWRG